MENGRVTGPLTNYSGAVSSGSSLMLAANPFRKFVLIQNTDAANPMWVNFGTVATASSASIKIAAGSNLTFDGGFIPSDAIYGTAGSGSVSYAMKACDG